MNEEICCINNKGKMDKNVWENNDSNFFSRLIQCKYKKLGQTFFHTYLLTCLNKDTSVLLKFINKKLLS